MGMQQMLLGAGGGVPGPDIDDVFSVDTWSGNSSNRTITNGLDFSGEGGMVWSKNRTDELYTSIAATSHNTYTWYGQSSINTFKPDEYGGGEVEQLKWFKGWNSDGFDLGDNSSGDNYWNKSGKNYVGWSFRQCDDFFRCGAYTGDGNDSGQTINHGMTTTPGFIISKMQGFLTWTYHKAGGNGKSLSMSSAEDWETHSGHSWSVGSTSWNAIDHTVVENNYNNTDGWWMAFADHSNGGSFGSSGNKKAIICDSYTGNGSSSGPSIDLGFQPQWIMIKNAEQGGSAAFNIFDSARGWTKRTQTFGGSESTESWISVSSTGFSITTDSFQVNQNGNQHIFVAIAAST